MQTVEALKKFNEYKTQYPHFEVHFVFKDGDLYAESEDELYIKNVYIDTYYQGYIGEDAIMDVLRNDYYEEQANEIFESDAVPYAIIVELALD